MAGLFRLPAARKAVVREMIRGKGAIRIELLSSAAQEHVDAVLQQAPTLRAATARVIERHGQAAVERIKGEWYTQVKYHTGLSGLEWRLVSEDEGGDILRAALGRSKGTALVYYLVNPTTYTAFVHPAGTKRRLVETIVAPAMVEAQAGIRSDLAQLFRLALLKIREMRAAAAKSVTGVTTPASILTRIREFFGA